MLSIDLSDAGQKGKSRSGKLVWGLPQKTVYAKCHQLDPDFLANRDLDAGWQDTRGLR